VVHSPSPRGSPSQSALGARVPLEERLRRVISPPPAGTPSLSGSPAGIAKTLTPVLSPMHLPVEVPRSPMSTIMAERHSPAPRIADIPDRPLSASFCPPPGVDIADMRSALDRLVEDVKSNAESDLEEDNDERANKSNISNVTSEGDVSMAETEIIDNEDAQTAEAEAEPVPHPASHTFEERPVERTATAPTLSLPDSFSSFRPDSPASPALSHNSIPPPLPAKDSAPAPPKNGKSARQEREDMIKERRRQLRARESGEFVPPRRDPAGNLLEASPKAQRIASEIGHGRPSRRRTMSTGDAEDLSSPVSN
jgi:hypothetical protein